jgi:hypothetical protein
VLQKVVDESEFVLHNLVSVLHENVHAAVVLGSGWLLRVWCCFGGWVAKLLGAEKGVL